MTGLKMYRSHKKVLAAKIIGFSTDGVVKVEGGDEVTLDPKVAARIAGMAGENPIIGGYLVVYEDSYTSWSPADAFEAGNTAVPEGPNRFRPVYRELDADEKARIEAIKDKAAELEALFKVDTMEGRCGSIAVTNLEQCVMWAVKGLTA